MMKLKMTFLMLLVYACSQSHKNKHVLIETRLGKIEIELYPDKAPESVAGFLANIDSGYYENCSFYRVLSRDNQPSYAEKTEIIQGGIWRSVKRTKINRKGIPHETTEKTKLLHVDGTISFARLEPGTATTEFFICIDDQPSFDFGSKSNPDGQGYAAFGKVLTGMDIVRRIQNQREYNQAFDPPINIYNIRRL